LRFRPAEAKLEAGAVDDDAREDCSHASHGHQVTAVIGCGMVGRVPRTKHQEQHIDHEPSNEGSEPRAGKQGKSLDMGA
jgi:hypothetical protein